MKAQNGRKKSRALVPSSTNNPAGFQKHTQDFLRTLSNDPTVTVEQQKAIAELIRLSPESARIALVKAREMFLNNASKYVEIHLNSTRAAYAAGEFALAAQLAQWALAHIATRDERLLEEPETEQRGSGKVMVGVQIGGRQVDIIDAEPG